MFAGTSAAGSPELAALVFLVAVATAGGALVAVLVRLVQPSESRTGLGLDRGLMLIALSLTSVLLTVQGAFPLSIGLLAALTLVRFRIPVKDAAEVGPLMLVVALSVACASFKADYAGIVLACAVLPAWLAGSRAVRPPEALSGLIVLQVEDPAAIPALTTAAPSGASEGREPGGLARLQTIRCAADGALRLEYAVTGRNSQELERARSRLSARAGAAAELVLERPLRG
jgi:hypothetical protein